jgi:hypothetical protein
MSWADNARCGGQNTQEDRPPEQISPGLIVIITAQENSTLVRHRESLAKDGSRVCTILEKRKKERSLLPCRKILQ